jgi:hypothetical protein
MMNLAHEEPRVWPGTLGPSLRAGVAAGLIGGAAMAAWAVGAAAARGVDWTVPLQLIGTPLAGRLPLLPAGAGWAFGLALHLTVSAFLGLLFAALLPHTRSAGVTLLLAVGYALLVMVVSTGLVLPVVNPPLRAAVRAMTGSWLVEHLLFGASLALVPALRPRFSARV